MSRLSILTRNQAQTTVEELYKDLERRIIASPPGLCPVDLAASFLKVCHAQSCGKCVPCRIGLGALQSLLEDVLEGKATLETIDLIEETAEDIARSADCAIGYEAAEMVLKGVRGFRDDYVEHITKGRCISSLNQPVPCVALCPANVDIPGYIAIGAHTDKKIGIEGEEAEGVTPAVEMLRKIGDQEPLSFQGEDVIVIGGGNVAMDVARSAIRLGAEKVRIVYRRRIADMTALPEEVEGAIAEGCQVMELMAPVKVEHDENNKACALWVQPQIIGTVKKGRPAPVQAKEELKRLSCDRIIVAIGQGIETKALEESGIPIKRGVVDALNWSGIQDIPGVFAGGDCVTGPATVIRAIAAGKVAAANIDEYLGFHHPIEVDVEIPKIRLHDRIPCGRVNLKERNATERKKDFALIETGMTHQEACQEASRCLRCDHFGFGSFKGGRIERW